MFGKHVVTHELLQSLKTAALVGNNTDEQEELAPILRAPHIVHI